MAAGVVAAHAEVVARRAVVDFGQQSFRSQQSGQQRASQRADAGSRSSSTSNPPLEDKIGAPGFALKAYPPVESHPLQTRGPSLVALARKLKMASRT